MQPLPIRIISTDFDGTVHSDFDEPAVPEGLQRMLAELQSKGVVWVINTGREIGSLMETLRGSRVGVLPDYLVTVEREIHVRKGSGYVALEEWNKGCTAAHETLFRRILPTLPPIIEAINNRFQARVYEDLFSPLCLIAANNEDCDQICEFLEVLWREEPEISVVRNSIYARLSHSDYNKGSALNEIGRLLGVGSEQIVAAGDHLNDLPMLKRSSARWLIAPHNAVEAVKKIVREQDGYVSTERCGTGVAQGLMHWMRHLGEHWMPEEWAV
ncbi:MAG: Cof-type HAD-IIB family hydrolase [Verrucomicrobia bacterium]|nr:Cof-type HAD-IIB family hydrolase [Verrucomicrobiota bacterium]